MKTSQTTLYERLGGEAELRQIVSDFLKRVYADSIIGFMFVGVDQEQLIQREVEFASLHLGGPHQYRGRGMRQSHRPHPINSGHFRRRLWILEQVLGEHGVAEDIIQHWLSHNRMLESAIVSAADCAPPGNR